MCDIRQKDRQIRNLGRPILSYGAVQKCHKQSDESVPKFSFSNNHSTVLSVFEEKSYEQTDQSAFNFLFLNILNTVLSLFEENEQTDRSALTFYF